MFDVGFGELVMLALVALLVVGPERLPKIARTAGLWLGRARRMLVTVKADIEKELKAEELKEILNKQALSNPLEELIEEGSKALKEIHRPVVPPEAAKHHPAPPSTPPVKGPEE